MSPSYLSPGVYVEEVDRGNKPISVVGTAVAAFIGYTERASETRDGETESLVGKPTLVTNWSQYVSKFGGFIEGAYMPDSIYGYFANGGGRAYVISIKTLGAAANEEANATAASISIPGTDGRKMLEFTAREAGPSGNNIAVEVKPEPPKATASEEGEEGEGDEPQPSTFSVTIKAGRSRESYDNLELKGERSVQTIINEQSELVTVTVSSSTNEIVPESGTYALAGGEIETKAITVNDYRGSVAERRSMGGLEPLDDVTMICAPDLVASHAAGEIDDKTLQGVQQSIIDYCERVRYCFAILDAPADMMPQQMKEWRNNVNYDSSRAALYYPWVEVANNTGTGAATRMVPPSGHLAGIYARVDGERGVHKAPANEIVRGALGLGVQVTKGEQDMLNPIGVNCIRAFPGRGIRVWGARTLSSDPAWRYINVRRLFNMVEESIEMGTQWVVFEPNDPNLWARVRRDVTAFLRLVWRSGALFGTTPEQAFFVKCDEETNPPEVRDAGQMVVEIGLSPVKPAEFVIFRISQWAGPNATE